MPNSKWLFANQDPNASESFIFLQLRLLHLQTNPDFLELSLDLTIEPEQKKQFTSLKSKKDYSL